MSIFNEAIETHAEWKLTLIKHFNEGMAIDDAKAIQSSHLCELGRWIDGKGIHYAYLPSFEPMRAEHEEFHRVSSELAEHINAGETAKAREMLAHGGAFRQSSAKLVAAIMECSKEVDSPAGKSIKPTDKIKDILKAKTNQTVFSVNSDTPVLDAIKLMVKHNIGSLAVYKNGEFLGIFTDHGFMQHIAIKSLTTLDITVADMTDTNTIFVQCDDSISQCMVLMTSTRTRHLPVIKDGRLVGIISIGDIIKKFIPYNE